MGGIKAIKKGAAQNPTAIKKSVRSGSSHGRTISLHDASSVAEVGHHEVKKIEENRLWIKHSVDKAQERKFEHLYAKRKGWVSEKELSKLIQKHSVNKIERALDACRSLWTQNGAGNTALGMKKHEYFKIALFIETHLKTHRKHHEYYRKEKTKLARTIRYDRKTKRAFVHLKSHNIKHLGTGCHKEVTRSILYGVTKPQIVATSVMSQVSKKKDTETHQKLKREVRYIEKFIHAKGLAKTYAIGEHRKKHSHKKVIEIIQKLYGAKSMHHYQQNPKELTRKEKLYVARDLLRGLESLHKKDVVHRDLHGCNILLNREIHQKSKKTPIEAAIIDLGQAMKADKAKKMAPKVQVPKRFNSAESFWRKHSHINAKSVDLYALGLNLYHLYFGVAPEWAPKKDFKKIHYLSDKEKVIFRKKLISRTERVLAMRKKEIEKNKSSYYDLERVIITMCDPHQKRRKHASTHRKTLDALIKKIERSA